jgi:hypothetical protein
MATRRRSSLLTGLDAGASPPSRRQSATLAAAAAPAAATSTTAAAAAPSEEQQQLQQQHVTDPAARKTHEQLAQCRADFLKRMNASMEEAAALGGRGDVLAEHQRAQASQRVY